MNILAYRFLFNFTLILMMTLGSSLSYSQNPSQNPNHSQTNNPSILILGDSLSAGYGLNLEESWPALLQAQLNQSAAPYQVHNASISGQTSAEGAAQIDELLARVKPNVVILELGANDGLRGLSIKQMKVNLQTMIEKSQQQGAQVLLVGIRTPDNYGRRYGEQFRAVFANLAQSHNTGLVPFMLAPLESVITETNRMEYIQADGLHPTAKAQPLILQPIWQALTPLLALQVESTH